MRHRVASTQLNRDANHRQALLKNLVRNLIVHGSIVTSQAKAKLTKQLADSYIHMAQTDTLSARRNLHKIFGKKDIVNTLVERVAPLMKDRQSGFTTISIVGNRRGDNTLLAKLELVKKPEILGTLKSGKTHEPTTKAKVVAKIEVEKAVPVKAVKTTKVAKKSIKKSVQKKAAPKTEKK